MILSEKPDRSTELAETILIAVERADLDGRSFGLDQICEELPVLAGELRAERIKNILVASGYACATGFVATWVSIFPDDKAPILALEAVQGWLAEPTQERAERAASRSQAALQSFVATKGNGSSPSWPTHAWFARTSAWLADAPQYGWQSVAALLGLIKAGMRVELNKALAAELGKAQRGTR